jgi:hypothetical protein
MKPGLHDTPSIEDWLKQVPLRFVYRLRLWLIEPLQVLPPGSSVGIDPRLFSKGISNDIYSA